MGHRVDDPVTAVRGGGRRGAGRSLASAAALVASAIAGAGRCDSEEGNAMVLQIELRAGRTDLLFQESPTLDFTLRNAGRGPFELTHPGHSTTLPKVRLVDVRTGRGALSTGHSPEGWVPDPVQPLAPGATIEWTMSLSERAEIPAPGEWDVSLVHPYAGTATAESNAVRLRVRPSTPANLALAGVGSPSGSAWHAAWIDVASTPPRLVCGALALGGEHPRLAAVAALVPAAAGSRPVVSTAANGVVSRDAWIAWTESGRFRAVHVAEATGASAVREATLPAGGPWSVVAVHTEPLVDPAVRPAGSALLAQESAAGTALAVAELSDKGAVPGPATPLPGARAQWVGSVTKSDGARTAFVLQPGGGRVALRSVPWPGSTGKPADLGTWTGDVAGAAAVAGPDDETVGAILLRSPGAAGAPPVLRLVQWRLDADGTWRETGASAVPWESPAPPAHVRVRVSGAGSAWVLLRDAAGKTWLRRGTGETKPVACAHTGGVAEDVAFEGPHVALLLCAVPEFGWHLANPDGSVISR